MNTSTISEDARSFSWLLNGFVEKTAGVTDAVAAELVDTAPQNLRTMRLANEEWWSANRAAANPSSTGRSGGVSVQQRSVALDITRKDGSISLTVPTQAGLVLSGWYMLFVTNRTGTPSVARWIHVQ